jgi:hypothetical protein
MDLPPDGKAAQLGRCLKFGFENPFQLFNLPPDQLGITLWLANC